MMAILKRNLYFGKEGATYGRKVKHHEQMMCVFRGIMNSNYVIYALEMFKDSDPMFEEIFYLQTSTQYNLLFTG